MEAIYRHTALELTLSSEMATWHYAGEWETEGANEIILIDVLVHDLESNQRQVWITDDELKNFIPKWVES